MKKKIIICSIVLVITYLVVGYIRNEVFVAIDWVDNVTIWQRLNEYYIRTFFGNLLITSILSFIPISLLIRNKKAT